MPVLEKYKYIYKKTEIIEQVEEFIYLSSIINTDERRSKKEHNKTNVLS